MMMRDMYCFMFLIYSLFFCEFVTGHMLTKCDIVNDKDCEKNLYQRVIHEVAGTGIPSANISAVDPIRMSNVVTVLPESVRLTLVDGVATGVKDCVYNELRTSLQYPYYSTLNMTCNVVIQGIYKICFPNSLMIALGGQDMHCDVIEADGYGAIIMDNININMFMPFELKIKHNCLYARCTDVELTHDAADKIEVSIDFYNLQSRVNSYKIREYLSQHSNLLLPPYKVIEKTLEFYHKFLDNYLANIPASEYITNELAPL